MKIAYNPLGSGALPKAPDNKDITFDLAGKVIYALGVPFDGKDTKYTVFKKHTSSDNKGGSEGLVPIPSYSTTNTRLLREDGQWVSITGITPPDTELSTESINAVQNKVITNKINEILASIQLKAADVYKNIKVGNTTLVASGINDTLEFKLGNGIIITPNATNKTLEFSINATGNLGINTSYNNNQLVVKILDEYYNKWNAVYDWYISVTEEDTDNLINKWLEIVDFLNSIAEGTNILDEFVTRKTDLTIIGGKTFSKQIISSVAQGTAPFSVESTTVVSKLNADLLDGYNADGLFTNLSNDTNLLSVTIGGTNKKLIIDYANAAGRLEGGSIATWGTLTSANGYTNVATYDYGGTKGAFSFAGKGGQLSLQVDGFFYQNEGRFLVLDTNNYSTHLDNRYYTETEINNKLKEYLQLIGGIMTGSIILKGNTSADMTYSGNIHPALCFENSDSSQNIRLIFTDYDSYRSPAGLKLVGNQGGEWLEVAGITYGPGFYHTSYGSANYLLTSNGGAWAVHTGRNNEANKIVRTDANGYIQAGWINTTSGDMGTTDINKIYCSNDGYIRYKTPADFFNILANDGNQISITVGSQNRKLTVNYATTSGRVIMNLHTSNNTEYPIVWTNSNNTTNAVAADLFKSYSHLTYNPSARRIISGQYLANNAAGPHFVAQSTEGNWSYVRLHNGSTYWDIATRSDSGSGGLWLARLKGADNGIFVSTGNNIGISTSNPADKLDAYGIIRSTANSRYLRIGPQNSSHAHYETNADISHWFNKRVDVNGAIWRYNTNYGIDSDGKFYAHTVYANRSESSTAGGVSLYSTSDPMTYGIAFRGTGTYGTHGGVSSDWATYLTMSDTTNRGWIFRRGSSNVFSISGTGYISSNNSGYFAGNLSSANSGASSPGDAALEVREYARAGTNTSTAPHSLLYAPRIGFHWGNRYWGNLIYYDDTFRFMNHNASSYIPIQASTITGGTGNFTNLTVINDSSNTGYDALAYFRNYGNADWAVKIDCSTSYTYGLHINSGGDYALMVGPGNSKFTGAVTIGADATPSYTLDVRGKIRATSRIYANEWIEFSSGTGLYWPNSHNQSHLYPNNTSSYGNLKILGNKGGYTGIHLGASTSYMTVMSTDTHHGLYCENTGIWEFYYNRSNSGVGIRTSTITKNFNVAGLSYLSSNTWIGTTSGSEMLNVGGWVGTVGNTGWYSVTHGGGWYMTDTTYVRSYSNKRVYNGNTEQYAFYTAGGMSAAKGFWHTAVNSNSYVLLAGGSYKALSDFSMAHSHPYLAYNGWWTSGNGNNANNASGMVFAYSNHNVPSAWGILTTFDYQLNSSYRFLLFANGYSNALYYRSRSADLNGWTGWYRIIDLGNIGSQSVNYATTAGTANSVAWANVTGKPTIPSVGNGTVTIKLAGVSKGSFTMNQSGNTTIELTDTNTDTNTWRPIYWAKYSVVFNSSTKTITKIAGNHDFFKNYNSTTIPGTGGPGKGHPANFPSGYNINNTIISITRVSKASTSSELYYTIPTVYMSDEYLIVQSNNNGTFHLNFICIG